MSGVSVRDNQRWYELLLRLALKLTLTRRSKMGGPGLVLLGILIGALTMSFMFASRAVLGRAVDQGEPHAIVWAGISALAAALCATVLIRVRLVQGR